MIEIALTNIAAQGSFETAESLHFPGVISAVDTGMLCGNSRAHGSGKTESPVADFVLQNQSQRAAKDSLAAALADFTVVAVAAPSCGQPGN